MIGGCKYTSMKLINNLFIQSHSFANLDLES